MRSFLCLDAKVLENIRFLLIGNACPLLHFIEILLPNIRRVLRRKLERMAAAAFADIQSPPAVEFRESYILSNIRYGRRIQCRSAARKYEGKKYYATKEFTTHKRTTIGFLTARGREAHDVCVCCPALCGRRTVAEGP